MYNPTDFQTPEFTADYMVSLIGPGIEKLSILEPTRGGGNLVRALERAGATNVIAPDNYFDLDKDARFDIVFMNPPFSTKYAFGFEHLPADDIKGMKLGYHILDECLKKSDRVIALMPWFTISDSDVRMRALIKYGLMSITCLPRRTFQYARIQTCVIDLSAGYTGSTTFKYLH